MEKRARLFAQAYEQSTELRTANPSTNRGDFPVQGGGMPLGDRSESCFPVTLRLEFSSWRTFLPRREALVAICFG